MQNTFAIIFIPCRDGPNKSMKNYALMKHKDTTLLWEDAKKKDKKTT